ncbi:MAG TPA: AmmeMemoRadiSam system protein B [Bacteroidales bacterium]|nr:AmmeMemoRadiSam system protein B [Bacteroidales bacterium]HPS16232.1 AmmeMemoRadiSam system protein B [Bacteroidales bacterium]
MIQLVIINNSCNSQDKPSDKKTIDRKPAVAGQFYAGDKETLKKDLKYLFEKATPVTEKNVFAVICPHAGYIYSGSVAASAINQVDPDKEYEAVFVIGASHRYAFEGASVYNKGNFITPLDTVEVDTVIANKLVKSNAVFQFDADYHLPDHCIEVQLPFLQYHLKKKFKIVPILIGTADVTKLKKIAEILKPYLTEKNLFVISSDFSHYPKYADAVVNDKRTADAIALNSPKELMNTINANADKKIPELVTSLCGYDAVMTLLYMTENMKGITVKPVLYKNSGEVSKDSGSVVGYWAIAFSSDGKNKLNSENEFSLTQKDKEDLLKIARNTLETYIKKGNRPKIDTTGFSETIKQNCGAFVTLKEKGELRGCIGRFMPDKPLYQIVQDMAVSASTEDYRFDRVTNDELNKITIEISVLSPLKKIKSPDEFILGKHGIYIVKNGMSGTFLPQVADETEWTKEEFLGHCARDKAGIGWDGWKTADLYIYTAVVFGEDE